MRLLILVLSTFYTSQSGGCKNIPKPILPTAAHTRLSSMLVFPILFSYLSYPFPSKVAITLFSNAVFSPRSNKQLKGAIDACIGPSAVDDCSWNFNGGTHRKLAKKGKLENEARARKERGYGAKLSMWDSNQCDPKHCSGHWLAQHGYVTRLTVRSVKA